MTAASGEAGPAFNLKRGEYQRGHIELGSVLIILAILGVVGYLSVSGTAWADLSFAGKATIIGLLAGSVIAAFLFNGASQWPNVDLSDPSAKSERQGDVDNTDRKA